MIICVFLFAFNYSNYMRKVGEKEPQHLLLFIFKPVPRYNLVNYLFKLSPQCYQNPRKHYKMSVIPPSKA